MNDILAELAKNSKNIRSRLVLTQEELAKMADINRSYLAGIESAQRNTSLKTVEKIAMALGVTPTDLVKPADSTEC